LPSHCALRSAVDVVSQRLLKRSFIVGCLLLAVTLAGEGAAGALLLYGVPAIAFSTLCVLEWAATPIARRLLILVFGYGSHLAGLYATGGLRLTPASFLEGGVLAMVLFLLGHRFVFGFPKGWSAYLEGALVVLVAWTVQIAIVELVEARRWLFGAIDLTQRSGGFYMFVWFIGLPLVLRTKEGVE
jgi:hypothetical protein